MVRTTLALTLLLWFVIFNGTATAAEPPEETKRQTDVVERLDSILKRLDDIEKRLAKLEATNRILKSWTVDDRGVMRTIDGRPFGYWGIDGPSPQIPNVR